MLRSYKICRKWFNIYACSPWHFFYYMFVQISVFILLLTEFFFLLNDISRLFTASSWRYWESNGRCRSLLEHQKAYLRHWFILFWEWRWNRERSQQGWLLFADTLLLSLCPFFDQHINVCCECSFFYDMGLTCCGAFSEGIKYQKLTILSYYCFWI